MMRNDETTTGAVIPAEILERLEAEASQTKKGNPIMDAAILLYGSKLSGAAIARAIGEKPKNVQNRMAEMRREKKI